MVSPINYSQLSGRADWRLKRDAVDAAYTQDSWKNDSPSIQGNLWGDDPFPGVDSNWDQPSKSFVVSLNQTLGNTATNTLQFSYSANKIEITHGGEDLSLHDAVVSMLLPINPYSAKQYGNETGHPVFWGGSGYPALWNEAPFLNNQDLFIIKDDYTKVFGKHFVKADVLASFNKKNEDTDGKRLEPALAVLGFDRDRAGRHDRQHPGGFLLRDMTFGFSEASTGRSAPQRWRDLEILRGGLVAGQPAVHVRFWRALLTALNSDVHYRQQDHEFRAGPQSGPGQRSV